MIMPSMCVCDRSRRESVPPTPHAEVETRRQRRVCSNTHVESVDRFDDDRSYLHITLLALVYVTRHLQGSFASTLLVDPIGGGP